MESGLLLMYYIHLEMSQYSVKESLHEVYLSQMHAKIGYQLHKRLLAIQANDYH